MQGHGSLPFASTIIAGDIKSPSRGLIQLKSEHLFDSFLHQGFLSRRVPVNFAPLGVIRSQLDVMTHQTRYTWDLQKQFLVLCY